MVRGGQEWRERERSKRSKFFPANFNSSAKEIWRESSAARQSIRDTARIRNPQLESSTSTSLLLLLLYTSIACDAPPPWAEDSPPRRLCRGIILHRYRFNLLMGLDLRGARLLQWIRVSYDVLPIPILALESC